MLRPHRIQRYLLLLPVLALGATACGGSDGQANANSGGGNYPAHPINWIVPYEPGGGSDTQVRRLQPYVQKYLGQRIHIVYKPGGDGAAGWQQLHAAKPDGYTIANVVSPNIMQLAVSGKAQFKATDFEYVTWTESSPSLLVTGVDSKFKTLKDFVEYARANPGKATIGGVGETNQVDVKQIEKAIGAKLTYVPVSGGSGPIATDLAGGHLDVAIESSSGVVRLSSQERGLAVADTRRAAVVPDIPTFTEAGYPGWIDKSAWGVIAPKGTPDSVIKSLNKALTKAVKQPKVRKAMKKDGLTPLTMSPKESIKQVKEDLKSVREEQKFASK